MPETIPHSNRPLLRRKPLRTSFADPDAVVVFATDVLSQPQYREVYLAADPLVGLKCARALPLASTTDIVVLPSAADPDYVSWLRGLELGPTTIISYDLSDPSLPLSEAIARNPKPVREALDRIGRRAVLVPFYSGDAELAAARAIGATLFGCDERTTLKYFDKESFKAECRALDIAVVEGTSHDARGRSGLRPHADELASRVIELLQHYPSVIIRGTVGAGGKSVYTVDNSDADAVEEALSAIPDDRVLVEPLLTVIASPNDQWLIEASGEINHIGVSAQIFEGLRHKGNLKGQYFSKRIYDYIRETSGKIVSAMADGGYRGIVGIDYIVSDEGIFPIENNARMNGSSFTFGIIDALEARHGRIGAWKFFKARTNPTTFAELARRIAPLLYDGSSSNAVFPYDCEALAKNGTFAPVLCGEDMYHIEYLEEALRSLGVEHA